MPVLLGKLHKAWRLLQCLALPAHRQTRFDHRTKTEHRATILLPNPVAADDTERHATDRPVKIRRQINTRWGGRSRAAIAVTEFRVRYFNCPTTINGIGAHDVQISADVCGRVITAGASAPGSCFRPFCALDQVNKIGHRLCPLDQMARRPKPANPCDPLRRPA